MLGSLAKSLFGSANDRKVKPLWSTVAKINALEPRFQAMSDSELAAMTPAFRERLEKGESLDDLLPEAFAVVREAAKRTLGQRLGSSRVDLQACKLEYSIVSPK